MSVGFFEKTFKNLQMPVIVCENADDYPLVFANTSARLLCNPLLTIDKLKDENSEELLSDFLRFQKKEIQHAFFSGLGKTGTITGYKASLLTEDDEAFFVYLAANSVSMDNTEYIVIYANEDDNGGKLTYSDVDNTVAAASQIANQTTDIGNAIEQILSIVGTYVDVSRVYVFEEMSSTKIKNTYEWCNDGIKPAIQDLQELAKDDYNYNEIIENGTYVTDDIRNLPNTNRLVLEKQNIKSLAIIALYGPQKPLGYVGFCETTVYREWGKAELQLLKGISNILVALIVKRNAFAQIRLGAKLVQDIMDTQDSLIYVSDIDTHEIIFVNKAFAEMVGKPAGEILGRICHDLFHDEDRDSCDFCPKHHLIDENGNISKDVHTWDYQNPKTGKWYMAKDTIATWLDGRLVHIQNASEITNRKEYEEKLEYYASTDTLTGAHNRDWGYQVIANNILNPSRDTDKGSSLVFIDIDGLKDTNDNYGHDAGDNMLIETVNIIRAKIRQSDMLFRWGGDEFILILEGVGDASEMVMSKIQSGLDEFNEKYNLPYKLSFSYGITKFDPQSGDDIDTVINRADKLMYQQKLAKKLSEKE